MATISGRVTAPAGKTVEGTTVSLHMCRWMRTDRPPVETTVSSDGGFRFESLPWGVWFVHAFARPASGLADTFGRGLGSELDVHLPLPRGGSIHVRVVDGQERPVAGGWVSALSISHERRGQCYAMSVGTDPEGDGTFRIAKFPRGPVRLEYVPEPPADARPSDFVAVAAASFDDIPAETVTLRVGDRVGLSTRWCRPPRFVIVGAVLIGSIIGLVLMWWLLRGLGDAVPGQ